MPHPVYYVFDAAGQIMDCDGNGIPDEAESTPREPNLSPDWIASQTEYDVAGRAFRTTDNLGRVMHADFDLLNRTIRVIENYVDGVVTETETDTDQTVEYDYDAAGRMTTLRAKNPKGSASGVEDQETRYLFESPINGSWTTNVIYPDSADTDSTGTDQVKSEYDRLGRYIRGTDQRGVEHTITFDAAGRVQSDAVTNLGPSGTVDDSILRIARTYDDVSRVATITSFNAASGGNVVNQVAYQYNGYGLVSVVSQEHDGTVNASTPEVRYHYNDGATAGQARYVRLSSVEYPGGREVFYLYPASGIGDALSRVEAIADDAAGLTRFAEYGYLGGGTIVEVRHPDVTGGLTLSYNATGNYEGWDRFGRVVNQQWTDAAGTTTLDHYTYTYDRNSNRTSRSNVLNTSLSETYGYDGLDRLVDANRAGSDFQNWTLDGLGNWNDFTDEGTTQTREHNAANELTEITTSGVIDPTHDAAGNMTSGPRPDNPTERQHYKWDAWNRLVRVQNSDVLGNPTDTIADFEYDGRNYRVQKTGGGVLQAFFHNENHQVLEVRKDGDIDPSEQYVWDLRYIDAPVVRFHDANTDGDYADASDSVLYYANDANMNVTALIDGTSGDVVERYHYDPYGNVQTYDNLWTPRSTSMFDNAILYTGRYLDAETGLFYYRARYYDSALGRFTSEDPLGYETGLNVFMYVDGNPLIHTDPRGLIKKTIAVGYSEETVLLYDHLIDPGVKHALLIMKRLNYDVTRIENIFKDSVRRGGNTYNFFDPANHAEAVISLRQFRNDLDANAQRKIFPSLVGAYPVVIFGDGHANSGQHEPGIGVYVNLAGGRNFANGEELGRTIAHELMAHVYLGHRHDLLGKKNPDWERGLTRGGWYLSGTRKAVHEKVTCVVAEEIKRLTGKPVDPKYILGPNEDKD